MRPDKRYIDHWIEAGFECATPIKNSGAGAAGDYYYSAIPDATREGLAVFVAEMVKLLNRPGLVMRAKEARGDCDFDPYEPSALQVAIRDALVAYIAPRTRPPQQDDKARAFAETIAAVYTDANVQAAMRQAAWAPFDPDHKAAWEREAEIERNRRRPGRRALYWI
jgi:hypothetical protein